MRFVAGTSRADEDRGALGSSLASAAGPAADSDLAELLEAARESAEGGQEEQDAKVSQDDIDALFGN